MSRGKKGLLFITFLVLCSSFSVLAGLILIGENMNRVLTLWGESLEVSVYLSEDVTQEQIDRIQNQLQEEPRVQKLSYVSQQAALEKFHEQMASYAPDVLKDRELMKAIPSSFQFSISSEVPVDEHLAVMKDLAAVMKAQTGVDDVSFGQDWVKSFTAISNGLRSAGFFLVIILFFAALFVMANAIRQSVHRRRDEIEVLELVGATGWFVRKPFLKEGALMGAVSSVVALMAVAVVFHFVKGSLQSQLQFLHLAEHIQFVSVLSSIALIALATVGGATVSYLCVREINQGWAAAKKASAFEKA